MENWLLLRGLSRQKLHWGDFPQHLARLSGSEVLFEDLPGFGVRNEEPSPSTIEGIAETIATSAFTDSRLKAGKINLVGISMGGMVALALAQAFPEKVASLSLINTSFKPYCAFYQRLQPSAYVGFVKAWFNPMMQQSEREILRLSSNFRDSDDVLLDQWLAFRRQQKPSRAAALKQIVAATRFSFYGDKPVADILFVASSKDKVVSPRCSENAACAWNADYRCHRSAGHDLPLDAPEWLAEELVSWRESRIQEHSSVKYKPSF